MNHISILIPKGQYSIVNIAGSFQILNWANDAYLQQNGEPLFHIEFVGHSKPAQDAEGYYTVQPPKTLEEVPQTDLIILPAVHGDLEQVIARNSNLINWMKLQYEKGTEIATFCVGVFILAETGILNGKACSTHWGKAALLQKMYPSLKVQPGSIITENKGVYTSGGAFAFTNLVIYLIEKYGGKDLAILTAKAFMIDMGKHTQSLFMIFNGQKDHDDSLVHAIQEHVEAHYAQRLSISALSAKYAISRRTLERRFRQATHNTFTEYLQRVRVEAAKRSLERSHGTVSEAMYEAGYNDPKAFRDIFKKYVGVSPAQYKTKFRSPQLGLTPAP